MVGWLVYAALSLPRCRRQGLFYAKLLWVTCTPFQRWLVAFPWWAVSRLRAGHSELVEGLCREQALQTFVPVCLTPLDLANDLLGAPRREINNSTNSMRRSAARVREEPGPTQALCRLITTLGSKRKHSPIDEKLTPLKREFCFSCIPFSNHPSNLAEVNTK